MVSQHLVQFGAHVFCKWRYNIFNLLRDLIERSRQFIEWKPLKVCHNREKSSDHCYCDSEDIKFSICHLTSCDYIFKELCEFKGGSPLR